MLYSAAILHDAVLFEGRRFALLAGPGALAVGYVLLVPKLHVECFVDLNSDALVVVRRLLKEIASFLRAVTGADILVFEHGRARTALPSSGCVDHAHLHFLPIGNADEIKKIIGELLPTKATLELSELTQLYPRGDYLLVSNGARIDVHTAPTIQSQLIRRLAAKALGVPAEWDWKFYPRPETLEQTIHLFKSDADQLTSNLAAIDC